MQWETYFIINGNLDTAENKISKLEDIVIESIQNDIEGRNLIENQVSCETTSKGPLYV